MKRNTKSSRPVDRSLVTSDNVVRGSRQKKPSWRLVETTLERSTSNMMSPASQQLVQNPEEYSARPLSVPRSSPRIQRVGSAEAQGPMITRRRITRSFGLPDSTTSLNEEELVTSSESNLDSRNDPVYDSSDAERDAAQDNDDDGASGIEAAREFLLRQDTASTSVSRQASMVAASSQSSQTSMSSPEVQRTSLRRKTILEDLPNENVEHGTKRQRTSLLGTRQTKYNSPYPALQISANPDPVIDEELEVRVLRSSSRSANHVTIVNQALPAEVPTEESTVTKEPAESQIPKLGRSRRAAPQDLALNSSVESPVSAEVSVEGPNDARTPRQTRRTAQTRSQESDNQPQLTHEDQRAENINRETNNPTSGTNEDTTLSNNPPRAQSTLEHNGSNFLISLISKDIEELNKEVQQSVKKEENLRKMLDFTIHRLETVKTIRDDPSRELYSDKPWQDLLFAVGEYITAKDPVPDRMVTEWHQLMAEIKLNFSKIEAMKKNLAKIVEENDDHLRKVKDRLDLHHQIQEGANMGTES